MSKTIIRINNAEIVNIKNVKRGNIAFLNNEITSKTKKSEIIGIYGQNGSGKTAFVDAMWIVKRLISGKKLPSNISNYIFKNSETAEIKISFNMLLENVNYQMFYEVVLQRVDEDITKIFSEKLNYKVYRDDKWTNLASIINYNSEDDEYIFTPQSNFKLLTTRNTDALINIGVAKKISEKNCVSFIFSQELGEVINDSKSFVDFAKMMNAIQQYIRMNLFIIRNTQSGMINSNFLMPFAFRVKDNEQITQGNINIELFQPAIVPEEVYNVITKIIDQMNIVLETIVPGLHISVKNYGKQLRKDGSEGIRFELVSIRDDIQVPLRYESDGIKKIISILSTMITMYNNPSVCMIVDELDAGIFEYLLGEILQIIDENGKGQLIFTSHNLRPLEKLDSNNIIFTTTNPENRYMRFTNVKTNNNLRKLYYRSINLGGQKEEVYKETNSFDISRAFRIAGRMINEN